MDIRALAEHLGLSIGTVSRALNDRRDVSAATRQRVLAAAALHNYAPNQSGRALRSGRTGSVAFILTLRHDGATHGEPFFMSLFEGIQAELAGEGLDLIVVLAREGEDQLDFLRRSVARGIADAWLLSATRQGDPRIALLLERAIPFVTLGRSGAVDRQPWIDLDFEDLVHQSVRHLHGAGHRRIALVAPPATVNNSHVVIDSYRREIAAAGLAVDDRLIHRGEADEHDGEAAVAELMALPDPPTAMLVMGETTPVGAYRALRALGLTPGQDVAVIGQRDTPSCKALQPALTCFTLDLPALGRRLARILVAAIRDPAATADRPEQLLWPMTLVTAQSSVGGRSSPERSSASR